METLKYLYNLAATWAVAAGAVAAIWAALLQHLKRYGLDVKGLPERLQPLPGAVFAMLSMAALAWAEGLVWYEVLFVALADGFLGGGVFTLGSYHLAKRASNANTKARAAAKLAAGGLLLVLLASCQPIKDASDYLAGLCSGTLAAQPDVQAEAERRSELEGRSVSPLDIAWLICGLNDMGRHVYDWFAPGEPDGSVSASQLDGATRRALTVARDRGVLR